MKKSITSTYRILYILAALLSVFFSVYSISNNELVWESGETYQRVLGSFSGFAAFTGIIATIKFYKREHSSFVYSMINAILFGAFSLSINLTGDFIVNVFWYIPLMLFLFIKIKKGEKTLVYRLTNEKTILLLILFILVFLLFWFLNPLLNNVLSEIVGTNTDYGSYFKYFYFAKFLDALMNSICIIAVVMMMLGIKETWYIWIPKNIAGIIFFSGVGIVNVSIILMNVIYLLISILIIVKNINRKELKIAIVGPGAVGKTTVIKHCKEFLENNHFKTIQEREVFINDNYDSYMNNMKEEAFKTQKLFFMKRMDQIERMQFEPRALMDRHIIDDFIFPLVHIKIGNFTDEEAIEWKSIQSKYWKKMKNKPKLDILFILLADDSTIETRRSKRSEIDRYRKEETKNTIFFREVNKLYHSNDSILYEAANKFAKDVVVLKNVDSLNTSKEIISIVNKKL